MADDVERNVLLKLKLLADDSNKAAAESVRSEVESLVEDMAAGYALVREAAIKEADKAAAGQVATAKKAAKDIQDAMAAAGRAIASPGTKLQGATVVSPGKGVTATGTATIGGGNKAAEKSAADAEKAFDREAAAAVKAYSRIMKEREKNARDAEKQADAEAAAAVRAYSRIMKERERLNKTIEDSTASAKQFGDQSVKSAAEGLNSVVKMGRGFAEVGLLSEETTEGMLKGLIRVQAGFDIITGGIDTYIKITEAVGHATKALEAQAAAQAAVNALQVAGGRAAAANAAGQVAGAAAGAVGTAGSAASAGGGLLLGAGKAATGLAAFLAPLAAIAAIVVGVIAGLNELVVWLGKLAGFDWDFLGASVAGLVKERNKAAESDKALKNKEKERENRVEDVNRRNKDATDADELQRTLRAWQEKLQEAGRDAAGLQGDERDGGTRADILAAIAAAKGQVDAEAGKRAEAKAAFKGDARAGEDLARTRLTEETEKLLQADQKRVQSLREQQKTQEQQVKTLRDQLAQQEKIVAQEKAAYQSSLAKLGALTKAEQLRAAEIAKKRAGGEELSEADARFLQSVGIGGKAADEFFANKAKGLGGDATLSGLGEGPDKIVEAEAERASIAQQLADAENGLAETSTALEEAMNLLKESIVALAQTVNDTLKFQQEPNLKNGEQAKQVDVPAGAQQGAPQNEIAKAGKAQADQVRQVGAAALESQKEMTDAFLAALDDLKAQNDAAIEAIRARQTRGALNAASGEIS